MKKKLIPIIEWINEYLGELSAILSVIINQLCSKSIAKLNFLGFDESVFQIFSTSILIIILSPFIKKIKKCLYQRITRINIIFKSSFSSEQSIEDTCFISFDNKYKLSKLYINIEVIGDPQLLLESKITINFPEVFTVNPINQDEDKELYEISPNRSGIIIEAKEFFNNEKTERVQENKTIGISLYKEGKDTNSNTELQLNCNEIYLENNKVNI